MKDKKITIDISHRTIVFTVLFLMGLYLLFLIKDIILLFFIALLIMTALNPSVTWLHKKHIPRPLSIIVIYVVVISSIIAALAGIIPPLVSQLTALIAQVTLPEGLNNLLKNDLNLQDLQIIANQLTSVPRIVGVVASAFEGVILFVTVLVITFYLLVERSRLHKYLTWLFRDHESEKSAEDFVNKIESQIGHWVRGQFSLMFLVGAMTYVGLLLLGVPYALPLAILAGILEILPNIGPTISAVPAILVAYFMMSPFMALAVLALYILIQQLESSFLTPIIMSKAVGLNPLITIALLFAGLRLGGIAGAVLAIPVFLVIKVVITQWYSVKAQSLK